MTFVELLEFLEAKAQPGQIQKLQTLGMDEKEVRAALAAADPSGKSSYGDWLASHWSRGSFDLRKKEMVDRIRYILQGFDLLKNRNQLTPGEKQLTPDAYPTLDSIVDVLKRYEGKLPEGFMAGIPSLEKAKGKKSVRRKAQPKFKTIFIDDPDELHYWSGRPTWERRRQPPLERDWHTFNHSGSEDEQRSPRGPTWCTWSDAHGPDYLDSGNSFILMMKYEPRMIVPGSVPDPAKELQDWSIGHKKGHPPEWTQEDSYFKDQVLAMFAGGKLVQDNMPYTSIYMIQAHDASITLWTLDNNALQEEEAGMHMAQYGSVEEQNKVLKKAVFGQDTDVKNAIYNFTKNNIVDPVLVKKAKEWEEDLTPGKSLRSKKVDLGVLNHMSPQAAANRMWFQTTFHTVPGVDISMDGDVPTEVMVSLSVDDERVWQALREIKAGKVMDPSLVEPAHQHMIRQSIKYQDIFSGRAGSPGFPSLAMTNLFNKSSPDEYRTVWDVVEGTWNALPDKELDERWLEVLSIAMKRTGASWEMEHETEGWYKIKGASITDLASAVQLEDILRVNSKHTTTEPETEVSLPGFESIKNFNQLMEFLWFGKGSKEKEQDLQNLQQWLSGLPMLPPKKDSKRTMEFYGRHAFSNKKKIAELHPDKKTADLSTPLLPGVTGEDVKLIRTELLKRGFKVIPHGAWPLAEYARIKALRVISDVRSPVTPKVPRFYHRMDWMKAESMQALVEKELWKGQPRISGEGTIPKAYDDIDLAFQELTGYDLSGIIETLPEKAQLLVGRSLQLMLDDGLDSRNIAKVLANSAVIKKAMKRYKPAKAVGIGYEPVGPGKEVMLRDLGGSVAIWLSNVELAFYYETGVLFDDMIAKLADKSDYKEAEDLSNWISSMKDEGLSTEDVARKIANWAREIGIIEEGSLAQESAPGGPGLFEELYGLADKKGVKEGDVDAEQLKKGIEVEKEHTESEEEAKKIALDHLAEIPDYYTRLAKMEKGVESGEDSKPTNTNPADCLPRDEKGRFLPRDTKTESLVEFSTPERQTAILWARGVPVLRDQPKHMLWFKENEAFSLVKKIAEKDPLTKSARLLQPRLVSAYEGRQIRIVEEGLRCCGYAVGYVEAF